MNKISVILPTYNRAGLVGRAISSVLQQTFQDFELIVVDDGSSDGTDEVVRGFSDPRIRYIKHDRNQGPSAAKNTGIKNADCDLIAIQDSDDESFPTRLEKEYQAILALDDHIGVVYSKMLRVSGRREYLFPSPEYTGHEEDFFHTALGYGVLRIPIGSALIRKQVFERVGLFDERLRAFDDFEFFIRAARSYGFYSLKEPLLTYHASNDNVSHDAVNAAQAQKRIFRTHYRDIKPSRVCLARHFQEIGHAYMIDGNFKKGLAFIIKGWVRQPADLRTIGVFLAALGGPKFYKRIAEIWFRIFAFFHQLWSEILHPRTSVIEYHSSRP